jgi:hypothetical protein
MNKPFVFVSSIVDGMQETRSLVKDFIENQLGYNVVLSENEGSKAKTPVAQCKIWSKECDIFIAILGERYGWVIPRLGISVSEMEYTEAYKDNPEKILVYLTAKPKDKRQNEFAKRIADFSKGYYRRTPFKDDTELLNGIREDLANFFKERIDFIRSKKVTIKPSITPKEEDYTSLNIKGRQGKMLSDLTAISSNLGFKPLLIIESSYLIATKNINRTKILFTFCLVPGNYDSTALYQQNVTYNNKIKYQEIYEKYPNRFTITIVLGNAHLSTLESYNKISRGICVKVEPGLFYGEALSIKKQKPGKLWFENRLVLPKVNNKQILTNKLLESIDWLTKESNRINFRCNYEKPVKKK